MKKIIFISIGIIISIIIYFKKTTNEHIRPVGIPETAIWAGGLDGGSWIDCISIENNSIYCRVYFEADGDLYFGGKFVLFDQSGKKVKLDPDKEKSLNYIRTNLSGADGTRIYLIDNSVLEPEGWLYIPYGNVKDQGIKKYFKEGKETGQEEKYDRKKEGY